MILQIFTNAAGQVVADYEMIVDKVSDSKITIVGRVSTSSGLSSRRNLFFETAIAGNERLTDRIIQLQLMDASGTEIKFRQLGQGEYVADNDFATFTYKVDLTPSRESTGAAHISWIGSESGVLMMADLLPTTGQGIRGNVKLQIPNGWRAGGECDREEEKFKCEFADLSNEVIPIGKDLRQRRLIMNEGTRMLLSVQGEWLFTDDEVAQMVTSIYDSNRAVFGSAPASSLTVSIVGFPFSQAAGTWQAEARGSNVTIVSSDMPFRTQSLQRLHEQLRHEIFHLWIPNGIRLTGDYAWFYEGFALYQSLKTGVAQNRITFSNMLDTLSSAAAIEARAQIRPLVGETRDRWSEANSEIYARGMLAAFAVDVSMIDASGGKESVSDLLASLYSRASSTDRRAEANNVILSLMNERKELAEIVKRNIIGAEAFDFESIAKTAGLELTGNRNLPRLNELAKPTRSQRRVLEKLGYNNWKRTPRYQNAK